MKLIDDWREAHRFGSVQVAALGALLGGIGAVLSGVADIWPWMHVMPRWLIWTGGALICACIVAVRLFVRTPGRRQGALSARRVPNG